MRKLLLVLLLCGCASEIQVAKQPTCVKGDKQTWCTRHALARETYVKYEREYWNTCYNDVGNNPYCTSLKQYLDEQYLYVLSLDELSNYTCPLTPLTK